LPTMLNGINEATAFRDQIIRYNPGVDFGAISSSGANILSTAYGAGQTPQIVTLTNSAGTKLPLTDSFGPVKSIPGKTPLVIKGAGVVSAGFDVYTLATAENPYDKGTAGANLALTGAASIPGTQTITGPLLIGFSLGQIANEGLDALVYDKMAQDMVSNLNEEINNLQQKYDQLNALFAEKCGCFVGSN